MTEEARDRVNSYLTDMLALEEHLEKAIGGQLDDFKDEDPEIVSKLRGIHAQAEHHIAEIKALSDARDIGAGKGFAEAVKRVGATFAGFGAAAIDLVRTERLPKNLRDDYTALNLALIGYVMLLTTARALDANQVADLAERHLRHYAQAVMTVHDLIPRAVVNVLRDENLPLKGGNVLPEIQRTLEDIWKSSQTASAYGTASSSAGYTNR
jgi:hypothetical protein